MCGSCPHAPLIWSTFSVRGDTNRGGHFDFPKNKKPLGMNQEAFKIIRRLILSLGFNHYHQRGGFSLQFIFINARLFQNRKESTDRNIAIMHWHDYSISPDGVYKNMMATFDPV